jgi:hypothetical protein
MMGIRITHADSLFLFAASDIALLIRTYNLRFVLSPLYSDLQPAIRTQRTCFVLTVSVSYLEYSTRTQRS